MPGGHIILDGRVGATRAAPLIFRDHNSMPTIDVG
jgi:hypothetical protein